MLACDMGPKLAMPLILPLGLHLAWLGGALPLTGSIVVAAVNGRIRESVGATHEDLARILIEQGAVSAMGFDPGGSATLIAAGRQLNVSPYNPAYEENHLSLPPCPRFVGNGILAKLPDHSRKNRL